jgi:hypothetical protein
MKKQLVNTYRCTFIAVGIAVALSGCHKKEDDVEPLPGKIGDAYQGGIAFYIDPSGNHGLLAASSDQSRSVVWFNGSFVDTGATSPEDGSANTDLIITTQGNTGEYAAKICRDYRGGGFSDWYLPSQRELNFLFATKAEIGGFGNNIYWTSSQQAVGEIWVQDFETGEQHLDNASDGANVAVRAVRKY